MMNYENHRSGKSNRWGLDIILVSLALLTISVPILAKSFSQEKGAVLILNGRQLSAATANSQPNTTNQALALKGCHSQVVDQVFQLDCLPSSGNVAGDQITAPAPRPSALANFNSWLRTAWTSLVNSK